MQSWGRARWLTALADLGLRRPGLLLAIVGVLCLAAAAVVPGLGVSTSRTGMLAKEEAGQKRLFAFYETFGRPEYAVFVVTGGEPEQRQHVVDHLQARLSAEDDLRGRVLGRVTPEMIAPLALLQQPQMLAELRAQLPPGVELDQVFTAGLGGWLQAIEDQIYAGLDGAEGAGEGEDAEDEDEDEDAPDEGEDAEDENAEDDDGAAAADDVPDEGDGADDEDAAPTVADPTKPPAGATAGAAAGAGAPAVPSPEQLAEGFERLQTLAGLLDDYLQGRDPLERFSQSQLQQGPRGIDGKGYTVSADGAMHIVSVFADLPTDEGRDVKPYVDRLRAIRDDVMADAPQGVRADVTGMPALIVDELDVLQRGLMTSSIVTTVGIALLCLLLFRSLRQMIIALLPLGPGVLLTLAAVALLYDDLNLITSSFVAVLLGLGIDFSVHAISRYNEELRRGAEPAQAVRAAMGQTGPGILTGAIVTVAAFLTTTTTEFTAFAELGWVTVIGLLVVVASVFLIVPSLLPRGKGAKKGAAPAEPPGLAALPGLVRRARVVLLGLGVVAAIAGAVALPRLQWNPRYFDFLPQQTESARGLDMLEYDPVASPVFANFAADSVEQARTMAAQLRALPTVAGVQTPSDLLPELTDEGLATLRAGFAGLKGPPDFAALAANALTAETLRARVVGVVDALEEATAALATIGPVPPAAERTVAAFKQLRDGLTDPSPEVEARVEGLHRELAALVGPAWTGAKRVADRGGYAPEDLPGLFRERFVSKDGTKVALFAVPAGKFWERDVAERFAHDVQQIYPDASGLAMMNVRHGDMVLDGFRRAAMYAAVLVVLLLALDFRSIKDALLALFPTVIGWLTMLAVMVALGLRFDNANIVSLPLVLGIGIAFGVHLMHRVREDDPRPDASSPGEPASLDTVVRGTGGAIAVAALTTMVGFGGLMTSAYGGMKSFGLVMVIGIFACLVATVVVLPALLLVLKRVK